MSFLEVASASGQVLLLINFISLTLVNIRTYVYRPTNMSRSMILLMLLLLGTLFIELYSLHLYKRNTSNIHLTHYYTIGQFFILSIIYFNQLKRFKLAVPIGVIIFSGVMIYQLITAKIVFDQFNIIGFLVSAVILICYAFFYYIEHITVRRYWDTYNFGLFFYISGSSVIFITMDNAKDFGASYIYVWIINALLVVLYQVFISITIYRFHRNQKKQDGISSI